MYLRWKLILLELIPMFLFGVAAFSTIMIAVLLLRPLLSLLFNYDVSYWLLGYLFVLGLPPAVSYALPMAMLLASLMSINRLSARGEMTALFAAGQSFLGVQLPIAVFGVLVSVLGLYLNERVNPKVTAISDRIQTESLGRKYISGRNIIVPEYKGGAISRVIIAQLIFGSCLENVVWQEYEGYRVKQMAEAQRACPGGPNKWKMEKGRLRFFFPDGRSTAQDFDTFEVDFSRTIEDVMSVNEDVDQLTFEEAKASIPRIQATYGASQPERVWRWMTQMYMKMSVPWVALIFALFGAPLGLTQERSGSSIGMGISVLMALVYYILIVVSVQIGGSGTLPPQVSAWIPNLVFIVLSGAFTVRANNPFLWRRLWQ